MFIRGSVCLPEAGRELGVENKVYSQGYNWEKLRA